LKEADFIQEIPKMKPSVLLISGGGNDILAENLRRFLSDNIPANPAPKDFFSPSFEGEMKALFDIYFTLFDYYKVNQPQLKIIVHGYSYLRPVEPNSKKTNWIGKYLDEKKILKEEDRLLVVRHLLDTFNEGLKKVAGKFENVHYIDLRKVNVRPDQWYDEIHPSDDGYQNISLQFIKKLNELVGSKV
jgi:lysophospholipase L1-like esterase